MSNLLALTAGSGVRSKRHSKQQSRRRDAWVVPPWRLQIERSNRLASCPPSNGERFPWASRATERSLRPRDRSDADLDGPRPDHHGKAQALLDVPSICVGSRRRRRFRPSDRERGSQRRWPVGERGTSRGRRRRVARDRRVVPARVAAVQGHGLRPRPLSGRRLDGRRAPDISSRSMCEI